MKSIRKLKKTNNHLKYTITKSQAKILFSSARNSEVLNLWHIILKDNDIIDDIIFKCIIKDESYGIIIELSNESDEKKLYEIDKTVLLEIINYVLCASKINDTMLKNSIKILESFQPNYLMSKLDVPIVSEISINKIINSFNNELSEEECIKIFNMQPEDLCEKLQLSPFFLDSSKIKHQTILDRLNIPTTTKEKIIINIQKFRYKYEKDKMLEYPFKTNEEYIRNFRINEDLKNKLIEELPSNFTKTQQIYYIYRRLCQILTYDESYFAGSQRRMYEINHSDIKRINKINESNSIIVCYETAAILACFCKELKIPFRVLSYEKTASVSKYGSEHLSVEVKVDNYVIGMDPTTGLINSDLTYEKVKGYVQSFWSNNKSQRERDNLEKELAFVDEVLISKTRELGYDLIHEKIKKLQKTKYETETLRERTDILINIILNNHLPKIDSLRYVLDCYYAIFSNGYNDFARIDFTSYYDLNCGRRIPKVAYVIVYNENKLTKDSTNDIYICIIDNEVKKFNKKEYLEFKKEHLMSKTSSSIELSDEEDELKLKLKK